MGRSFDEFLRYLFLFIALICLSLINATQSDESDDGHLLGDLHKTVSGFTQLN